MNENIHYLSTPRIIPNTYNQKFHPRFDQECFFGGASFSRAIPACCLFVLLTSLCDFVLLFQVKSSVSDNMLVDAFSAGTISTSNASILSDVGIN
jgi:hypothetical protein